MEVDPTDYPGDVPSSRSQAESSSLRLGASKALSSRTFQPPALLALPTQEGAVAEGLGFATVPQTQALWSLHAQGFVEGRWGLSSQVRIVFFRL